MRARLYATEAGLVLQDEGGGVLRAVKYEGDPYQKYRLVTTGNRIRELEELMRLAADAKVEELEVNFPGAEALADTLGIRLKQVDGPGLGERIKLMIAASLVGSEEEAIGIAREFAIKVSEERIKEAGAKLDLHAIQVVSSIDELDKAINALAARVREWYGLHFPELDGLVQDPHVYLRLVAELGRRDNFRSGKLVELGLPEAKASAIEEAAARSKGADIRDEELALVQGLASGIYGLYQMRQRLAGALEELMATVAPNVTSLAGATVGARLLARAGGLEGLSKMPASTIQVLGAEKALFRSLRYGSRPPKHGIIFQHPLVHGAPKWQRGKIARALASKLAIAARLDYYSGVLDPSLKEKFERRVEEIRKKYAKPPAREEAPKQAPRPKARGKPRGREGGRR